MVEGVDCEGDGVGAVEGCGVAGGEGLERFLRLEILGRVGYMLSRFVYLCHSLFKGVVTFSDPDGVRFEEGAIILTSSYRWRRRQLNTSRT